MKNLKWLFLLVAIGALILPSCDLDIDVSDDDDSIISCEDGDGSILTEELTVSNFTGIKLEIPAKVFITQGTPFKVEVEGQANIIDLIELDVDNDVWEIEFDRCARDFSTVKIFITMPEIEKIEVTGVGDVVSENTLTTEDLRLRLSGTGDIDLALDVTDEIDSRISGAGKIRLEGEAKRMDFEISGVGDLRAFDLNVETADLKTSGAGDMELSVIERLDVDISGAGDVYYKGNPTINSDISGTGEVIDAN